MVSLSKKRKNGVYQSTNKHARKFLPTHLQGLITKGTFGNSAPETDEERKNRETVHNYWKKVALEEGKAMGIMPRADESVYEFQNRIRARKVSHLREKELKEKYEQFRDENPGAVRHKRNLKKYAKRYDRHFKKYDFGGKKPTYTVYKQMLSDKAIEGIARDLAEQGMERNKIDEFKREYSQSGLQSLHTIRWRDKRKDQSCRWRTIERVTLKEIKRLPDWKNMSFQSIQ